MANQSNRYVRLIARHMHSACGQHNGESSSPKLRHEGEPLWTTASTGGGWGFMAGGIGGHTNNTSARDRSTEEPIWCRLSLLPARQAVLLLEARHLSEQAISAQADRQTHFDIIAASTQPLVELHARCVHIINCISNAKLAHHSLLTVYSPNLFTISNRQC